MRVERKVEEHVVVGSFIIMISKESALENELYSRVDRKLVKDVACVGIALVKMTRKEFRGILLI